MSFDFTFGKSFGDQLTPEQREIVDQLERGEISEQEARDRLGADVSLFFHELQLGGDDDARRSAAPGQARRTRRRKPASSSSGSPARSTPRPDARDLMRRSRSRKGGRSPKGSCSETSRRRKPLGDSVS